MTGATCCQIVGALILVVTTGAARADTIEVKMEKLGFLPAEPRMSAIRSNGSTPISSHTRPLPVTVPGTS